MEHETSIFATEPFWAGVSFLIFIGLFGGRLWKAIAGMLDARAEAVRGELLAAQALRAEAETLRAEAEAAKAAALTDAQEIMARAKHEAERVAAAAAAEARAAAQRRERMAMDRIAAAEKAAIAEIRSLAADIATTATTQVIAEGLTAEAGAPLIDDAIAGLPKALRAA